MVYTESIRGYPYMRIDKLAEEFGISQGTVKNRMKEIEEEVKTGRYNDYAIIKDGGIVLINVLVFLDYIKYRQMLLHKNARKQVPNFQPENLIRMIGWNNRIVVEDEPA